jgi:uncharacterized protein
MHEQLPRRVRQAAALNHWALLIWVPLVAILILLITLGNLGIIIATSSSVEVLWLSLCLLPMLVQGISMITWQSNAQIHPFVEENGKEAVNVWLSGLVYQLILTLIWIAVVFLTCGIPVNQAYGPTTFTWNWSAFWFVLAIGYMLISFVLLLIQLIGVCVAISRAQRGQPFRYPRTLRFIR